MITVDLRKERHSIDKLLSLAASETIIIYSKDGKYYVLEETDSFEKEVEELGNSKKFMESLSKRSEERESTPISLMARKMPVPLSTHPILFPIAFGIPYLFTGWADRQQA